MSEIQNLKLGLSQSFPCSYLPDQKEQLLLNCEPIDVQQYEQLLALGFRRSGNQVYRPHCQQCRACIPVRLPVQQFKPSSSQKRVLSKNRDLQWRVSLRPLPRHRTLYQDYIRQRHADGAMYPPSDAQFDRFLLSPWLEVVFLEAWLDQELVLVAVTDLLGESLSATYTFFQPSLSSRSLGTRAILAQVALAQALNRQHLYLGYQIDQCQKMAYKRQFQPAERFTGLSWQPVTL
ncbi:arginyltransferase [Ferrimonas marina]|uniref:Aspartate/glutamate leucyltransferase n=1 Tax=Ferrimonas marina TaxID=299255 RepID=A0A1M5N4E4_9GAMM|nr:arginyltransferase [Ferrimonas marina]SHG84049.1 arginine-tRNA-protein transferase [Ferrimonas marina]